MIAHHCIFLHTAAYFGTPLQTAAYFCTLLHTPAYLSVGDMVHVGPLEGSLCGVPHQFGVMASVDDQTIDPIGVPQLGPSQQDLVGTQWLGSAPMATQQVECTHTINTHVDKKKKTHIHTSLTHTPITNTHAHIHTHTHTYTHIHTHTHTYTHTHTHT